MKLLRFYDPERGAQLGVQPEGDDRIYNISDRFVMISAWLRASVGDVSDAIEELEALARISRVSLNCADLESPPMPDTAHWLAPVDQQDVWAAGVTYEPSRSARQDDAASGADAYARVYNAVRPYLFYKAHGSRVIGHRGFVGIRGDSVRSVPEPELAVVLNPALEVVGLTIANDMTSRDIESANPLYLAQAKVYMGSCALGPGILLHPAAQWPDAAIQMRVLRGDVEIFSGETHTGRIRRSLTELIEYLGRSSRHPDGVVLLTGTGIVPPENFTLQEDDEVQITIDGIGTLSNTVKVV